MSSVRSDRSMRDINLNDLAFECERTQLYQVTLGTLSTSEEKTRVTQSNGLNPSFAAVVANAHQRMRRCMNQQRYRKRQDDKLMCLEENIMLLREEIEMYQMRRSNQWSTIIVKPSPWNVVAEYYRLFRRGVNPSMSTIHGRPEHQIQYPIEIMHQRAFLETVMLPQVVCGVQMIGLDAHLDDWTKISRIYSDFGMKLTHLEEGPSGEMIATSKVNFIFTEDTLCNAFPHLVSDNNKNPIAAKLVGRRLEINGTAHFYWDDSMGRVTKLLFNLDMIQPILRVLGSLEHVSSMFNHAFVTLEGHIVDGY